MQSDPQAGVREGVPVLSNPAVTPVLAEREAPAVCDVEDASLEPGTHGLIAAQQALEEEDGVRFRDAPSGGMSGSRFRSVPTPYWLGRKRLRDVLRAVEPGGLIVSDGSLALRWFQQLRGQKVTREEAVAVRNLSWRQGGGSPASATRVGDSRHWRGVWSEWT